MTWAITRQPRPNCNKSIPMWVHVRNQHHLWGHQRLWELSAGWEISELEKGLKQRCYNNTECSQTQTQAHTCHAHHLPAAAHADEALLLGCNMLLESERCLNACLELRIWADLWFFGSMGGLAGLGGEWHLCFCCSSERGTGVDAAACPPLKHNTCMSVSKQVQACKHHWQMRTQAYCSLARKQHHTGKTYCMAHRRCRVEAVLTPARGWMFASMVMDH